MGNIFGMSKEVARATVDALETLHDIVGYHFPWCEAYLDPSRVIPCTCGMTKTYQAKVKLQNALIDCTKFDVSE